MAEEAEKGTIFQMAERQKLPPLFYLSLSLFLWLSSSFYTHNPLPHLLSFRWSERILSLTSVNKGHEISTPHSPASCPTECHSTLFCPQTCQKKKKLTNTATSSLLWIRSTLYQYMYGFHCFYSINASSLCFKYHISYIRRAIIVFSLDGERFGKHQDFHPLHVSEVWTLKSSFLVS